MPIPKWVFRGGTPFRKGKRWDIFDEQIKLDKRGCMKSHISKKRNFKS